MDNSTFYYIFIYALIALCVIGFVYTVRMGKYTSASVQLTELVVLLLVLCHIFLMYIAMFILCIFDV